MKKLGPVIGGGVLRLESGSFGQAGYRFEVWMDETAVVCASGRLWGNEALLLGACRQESAELLLGPEWPVRIRVGRGKAGSAAVSLLSEVPVSWYAPRLPRDMPLGLVRSH